MRLTTSPAALRESAHWQLWGLFLIVAVVLTAFAAQGVFVPGDLAAARAVQRLHGFEPLQPVSEALYRFALAPVWPVVTVLLAAAFWLKNLPLAAALIVLSGLLRPISLLLKEIVERPRPTSDVLPVIEGASGFSFPAGTCSAPCCLWVVSPGCCWNARLAGRAGGSSPGPRSPSSS
jgi:hypothetical protein